MEERRSSYNSSNNRRRSSSSSRYRKKKQSKFQKTWRKIVRFFKNNNQMALILVAVVVVILILILILSLVIGHKKQPADDEMDDIVISSSEEEETQIEASNDLLQDAYPELNTVIEAYFDAMKNYDVDAYNAIVTGDSMTEEKLEKKGEYIEDYRNISCYTKNGLADGTYIVYVYYEIKFVNVDTLCPSLSRMYVCTNDDGTMYINNGSLDTATVDYITAIGSDADVLALIAQVDSKMQAAIEADEMVEELVNMLQLGANYTGEEESEEMETDESGLAFESRDETVVTTDNVRIRSTPTTETSDNILMTVTVGTELHRIGYNSDWSKVRLNDGTEAYISSDYVILHSED